MAKKILGKIFNVICVLIIVFALFILFCVVTTPAGQQPNAFGYYLFRVLTGSMEPEIPTDSIVLVRECDPSEIVNGDVISFYSPDPELGGAVNTHRVVAVAIDGDGFMFTTAGDNNTAIDKYPVNGKSVIGKVVWVSHFIGTIVHLLQNPIVFGAAILIPLSVILIINISGMVKATKDIEREEIEKALEEARKKKAEAEAALADANKAYDESAAAETETAEPEAPPLDPLADTPAEPEPAAELEAPAEPEPAEQPEIALESDVLAEPEPAEEADDDDDDYVPNGSVILTRRF
ncbi:MAG: signal peptidase I [Firmicutes bacterium]|nr:signal peptidase I [Bacillota bacterium]